MQNAKSEYLPQLELIENLLTFCIEKMNTTTNPSEHERLKVLLEPFKTTTAVTAWSVEDINNIIQEEMPEGCILTLEDKQTILADYFHSYEISNNDWDMLENEVKKQIELQTHKD